jgi:hypothetical protein
MMNLSFVTLQDIFHFSAIVTEQETKQKRKQMDTAHTTCFSLYFFLCPLEKINQDHHHLWPQTAAAAAG